jgi:hypothetical protein
LSLDRRLQALQDARSLKPALTALCGAVLLTACSAAAPFSAAPRLPAPSAAGSGSGSAPAASNRPMAMPITAPPPPPPSIDTSDPRRRQYFDQVRKRYYFFDPVLKQYFWSDGTPK